MGEPGKDALAELIAEAMSKSAALTAIGILREQIAREIDALRDMHAGMDESWREGMAFAARIARSGLLDRPAPSPYRSSDD